MPWTPFSNNILNAAALIGAITTIGLALKYGFKVAKKLLHLTDTVGKIYDEFKPNGGSSLKDAINRIETRQIKIEERQLLHDRKVKALLQDVQAGIFETDVNGDYVWVNRTFTKILRRSVDDVLGKGWVTSIANAERDSVYSEWLHAVAQQRDFNYECVISTESNDHIKIHIQAWPLKTPSNTLAGYIGTYTEIN